MSRVHPARARALSLGALLLAGALCAAACRGAPPTVTGRTVRDGLGREVSLPAVPRRLVSLAPSVTESLFALGFGDRVVGVSDFCEIPSGQAPVARIGGMLNPDLETIRALHPDLLIGTTSGNDPALAVQAEGLGLGLYVVHTPDIEHMLAGLEDLAGALGDRDRGVALAGDLRARLNRIAVRLAGRHRPRVLFIVWSEPLVVPGAPAFLTDALEHAGAVSVSADAPAAHPSFSLESLVSLAPQVILTTAENRRLAERLPRDPAWALVPAVRDGRVHVLGGAIVRPGPGVVAGIEEAARYLHPGVFEPGSGEEKRAAHRGVRRETGPKK
jgi:iron complex transport system substrate-binding protein